MARKPRFNIAGIPQHVIQRGNNRQATFYAEQDYQYYLECLAKAVAAYDCDIHAYVLMTNHVHLLVTPNQTDSIARMMQSVGRRYVQYINYTYKRSGTLWEGRYKASLIQSETYLLSCMRYIELNPVRANMVTQPEDYQWSSYQANALGKRNEHLTSHTQYDALGITSEQRQAAYRALFQAQLDSETLNTLRRSVNSELITGGNKFQAEIETALGRKVAPAPRGRPSKAPSTAPLMESTNAQLI